MKKYHRQNFLKITIISLVLLLTVSALTLHITVSANKIAQEIETANKSLRSGLNLELPDERIKQIIESPVFTEFDVWVKQYVEGNFNGNAEQLKSGENLAAERRELFKELIRLAPKTALEYAILDATKNHLPASIAEHLERRVSAYGDLLVYALDEIDRSTGKIAGDDKELEVVIGETRYKACVYGRREVMTTKLQIPLQGIVLDGLMAVDENPARKLEPTEYASHDVDLSKLGEYGTIAEVGSEIVYFLNHSELESFVREQIKWEGKIGHVRPKENFASDELNSTWTEGPKAVLFIRVDFPDRPGETVDGQTGLPLTFQRAQDLMNSVNSFYTNSSYGKTSFQTVTVTPVIRLPQPTGYYMVPGTNGDFTRMMTDARNAARAAGFETNNYNLDIVASANTGVNAAGLGLVGSKGTWLIGFFSFGFPAHELGHNYGLLHANLWRTTDGTIIGQGNNQEGGDPFDVMGCCGSPITYFNAQYKRQLEWLTDANVQTVTSNGVYRIFAQDSSTTGSIRALKIRKDTAKNYWIEFRQLFTSNPNAMNGAIFRWDYLSRNYRETQLLDMTPNTPTNASDAPLLIGQSFYDSENRIRMTVLGKGNTMPESLDVRIELNIGCTFSLGQTSQSFSPTGGEGAVLVNTQSGCLPPTTSNDNWIYALPNDTGIVRYIVAANYDTQPRIGTLIIGGQVLTIQQSAATTACVQQPSNLVSWWRGEGNGLDQTGANNGILINNITFSAGKIGGGFNANNGTLFPGSLEISDSSSLVLNQSMTFEGWLKIDSYGGAIISRRNTTGEQSYMVSTSFENGRLQFFIFHSEGGASLISSPNPLPLGQFVHFAATYDDATEQRSIYINGSLVTQQTFTVNRNIISGAKIYVGAIRGITDELSVYNRALTASEIQAIYNAGIAPTGATGKCLAAQPQRKQFDFDGDGKSDVSVFRPSSGAWYLQQSTNGLTGVSFGLGTDKIVPADYDGDGKTDVAVYRSGTWYLQRSQLGFTGVAFGDANDIPVPADYDGDGKADVAVFRPSTGVWYLLKSQLGFTGVTFGQNGDRPVAADYDGDGKADVAVNRNGTWYIQRSQLGFLGVAFGDGADKPVPADYDGDGKTDIAVFRPSNGAWYLQQSTAGLTGIEFGLGTDLPVPADYDGDGKSDVAVFRDGTWYMQRTLAGFAGVAFGTVGDKPIPNAFVP